MVHVVIRGKRYPRVVHIPRSVTRSAGETEVPAATGPGSDFWALRRHRQRDRKRRSIRLRPTILQGKGVGRDMPNRPRTAEGAYSLRSSTSDGSSADEFLAHARGEG